MLLELISLALLPQLAPVTAAHAAPFPASRVQRVADTVEFELDARAVYELRAFDRLELRGLPWPSAVGAVDLDLWQEASPLLPGALHVNGARVPDALRTRSSLWRGRVHGEPDSDVFLAFAGTIAWGWVQGSGEILHVLSQPDLEGDWRRGSVLLVTERGLAARGHSFAPICALDDPEAPVPAPPPGPAASAGVRMPTRMLYGRLGVETDWQFFQIFGDLQAAQSYVVALLAAANTRFRAQLDVSLGTIYLGFHTTSNDPWITQETGGDCIDALYEFQAAWGNGNAPAPADLYHMLSGALLGCGVGFIDGLCDPSRAFSLTSHMDGLTPFPVDVSPLNWDFVWMCHELGHNFGSLHTHQYCPPLDECSPVGYWGACQDEVACTTTGTMMSYCHACPGGMANFTTWFHPVVADTMRAASEASCFRPFLRYP